MKKIIFTIILILGYVVSSNEIFADDYPYKSKYFINVNENAFPVSDDVYHMYDKVYIPVRYFFEYIGGTVDWIESSQTVQVIYGDNRLEFKNNDSVVTFNNEKYTFEHLSFNKNDKIYVSVDDICNLFSFDYSSYNKIRKSYIGIKSNDYLFDFSIKYDRYSHYESCSICINSDGSCVLTYYDSGKMHEIKIYPQYETLKNIIESMNRQKVDYRNELPKSDFVITDQKTIVLEINQNGKVEKYYPDDSIEVIENLFCFWLESIGEKTNFKVDDITESVQTIDYGYWENDVWTNLEFNYCVDEEVAVQIASDIFKQIKGNDIISIATVPYESECKRYYIIKVYEHTEPLVIGYWDSLWVTISKSNGRVVKVESFKD